MVPESRTIPGAPGGLGGTAGGNVGWTAGCTGPWVRVSSKKLASMRYLEMKANNPSGGICLVGAFWNPLDMSSSCSWCAIPIMDIGLTS